MTDTKTSETPSLNFVFPGESIFDAVEHGVDDASTCFLVRPGFFAAS
jgi:hypothetical protein